MGTPRARILSDSDERSSVATSLATMQRTDHNNIAVRDVHWSLNSGEYSLSFREIQVTTLPDSERKKGIRQRDLQAAAAWA